MSTLGVYVGLGGGEFASRLEVSTPATPSAIISATLTSTGLPDVALTALGPTADQGVVTIFQDSSSFATGSTPTQTPYPGAEFVDLGVKVKATPTLHQNHEVTLQLEFEIRALSGNNINGIPIISNRTLSQVVRVRDDETIIDQRIARQGRDALPHRIARSRRRFPAPSYAGSTHDNSLTDTEFMILVTPHRLRSRVSQARSILRGTRRSAESRLDRRRGTAGRARAGHATATARSTAAATPTAATATATTRATAATASAGTAATTAAARHSRKLARRESADTPRAAPECAAANFPAAPSRRAK